MKKRVLSFLLSVVLICSLLPVSALGAEAPLTRGEARDILLAAADDYNPGVSATDVMQGDQDGRLHEDRAVTETELLVMIARAFGGLSEPVGDSARWAYPSDGFSQPPAWAAELADQVFEAGVLTEYDSTGTVTATELDTLLKRIYALEASCLQDDFYAYVNREWLEETTIPSGYSSYTTMLEVDYELGGIMEDIILEIVSSDPADGSHEDQIKTLYENYTDWESRNQAGVEPILPYLQAIDGAATLDELMGVHNQLIEDELTALLINYDISQDLVVSSQKNIWFGTVTPALPREYYHDSETVAILEKYYGTLLRLSGEDASSAQLHAQRAVELVRELADAALTETEAADLDQVYNFRTGAELAALFPQVDLDAVRDAYGLPARDRYEVNDLGLAEAVGKLLTQERLEDVKLLMKTSLLVKNAGTLSHDFIEAANTYDQELLGIAPMSDEDIAIVVMKNLMPDYLGELYVEEHFSPEAKAGVEAIAEEILDTYAQRIQDLTWMGAETKKKAVEKLEAITVNVGYPDQWPDPYAGVDLRTAAEGGSYYENLTALNKAYWEQELAQLDEPVDKSQWYMAVYEVNAYYNPMANSINFPAGILRAPLYDPEASHAENLGGIGYVIAHEVTHAFDDQGARFDSEGNLNDWWAQEDYAAFQALCDQVEQFYDGVEAIPGVACSGELTLGENIADLGALACVTQIESEQETPDLEALFYSVARVWRSAAPRETRAYYAATDVHAPDKLRVNRALQSLDSFYETFQIQPGDGMYVPPEDRVQVW